MRMVFNFKMSLEDYHQMMVSRTFGNSWIRRIILLVVWLVFTGLIVLDLTGVIELTRIVHVCALLVAVSFPAAVITMEINVSKYKDAYLSGFKAERQIVAGRGRSDLLQPVHRRVRQQYMGRGDKAGGA